MMESINYSIIIPFRDRMDQLCTAIKSIPDRCDIQIIVIDNSKKLFSPDDFFKPSNAMFTLASSRYGGGAGCARNVGLSLVKGRYVLFLDSDDYFTPNAFNSFDRYLDKDYDIVFFKAESVNIITGERSNRHKTIEYNIDNYSSTKNEDFLRYKFSNPVCKMMSSKFIINNNIFFEEVQCANDVMFSVTSGHLARNIEASNDVVYIITEADRGESLQATKTKDFEYTRFIVAVEYGNYLKSVGKGYIRPRYISYIGHALLDFGPVELLRYIKYYIQNSK